MTIYFPDFSEQDLDFGIPPDTVYHDDVVFQQSNVPPFMWHRYRKLLDTLDKFGIYGQYLRIGIIDTGYSPHPWLPRPKGVINYTNSGRGRSDVTARNFHGQHVYGIIGGLQGIGLLPAADYYIAKGLNDQGSGSTTWLNNCIRWCAQQKCHYVNGSYGGPQGSQDDIDAINTFYNAGGRLLHFAAGNANYNGRNNSIGYPAKHDMGSTNGSYNADGSRSSFSSGGKQLDIMGAGGRIVSTMPPTASEPKKMGQASGTSMGSPDVLAKTGAYDQRRRQVGLPDIIGYEAWNEEYRKLFDRKKIKDGGAPGRDNYHGWGQFMTEAIIEGIEEPIGA